MAEIKVPFTAFFFLSFLTLPQLPADNSASKPPAGFSLELIPSESPKSPFYRKNLTFHDTVQAQVKATRARAAYWNAGTTHQNATFPTDIIVPVDGYEDVHRFVVRLGIGTPSQDTYLELDTGSYFSWTQGAACTSCFPQNMPKFEPTRSTSYQKVPCSDPLCSRPGYRCVSGECRYVLSYFGDRLTRGIASRETFTFWSRDKLPAPVPNIQFGCAVESSNPFFGSFAEMSGILGMGRFPQSLPHQMGGRFSYCLVNVHTAPSVITSYLRFGADIPNNPPRGEVFQKTKFSEHPGYPHAWNLNLVDISVVGHRVHFPPGTFAPKQDGSGGFIADSGAPFTLISRTVITLIIRVLRRYFGEIHHLTEVPNPFQGEGEGFELCYSMGSDPSQTMKIWAPITFHFEGGADFEVPIFSTYIQDNDGHFCLAMMTMGPRAPNILGAFQQQDMLLVYDANDNELSYAPLFCDEDG